MLYTVFIDHFDCLPSWFVCGDKVALSRKSVIVFVLIVVGVVSTTVNAAEIARIRRGGETKRNYGDGSLLRDT